MNALTTVNHGMQRLQLPTEAMPMLQLAERLSHSRTIPSIFQKSAADCFNVLAVCVRFGFDFYSTVWECSMIKNRLFYSGKMVHAMLSASGYLAERLNFEYTPGPTTLDKAGEEIEDINGRKVTVRGRIQGETSSRVVDVFVAEVKTANEHWTRSPDQMLSYAGARIWGRRHLPEVLLGMLFVGEEGLMDDNDLKDVTPTKTVEPPKVPEPPKTVLPLATTHDAEKPAETVADVIEPHIIPMHGEGAPAWTVWCNKLLAFVRAAPDAYTIHQWLNANNENLAALKSSDDRKHEHLKNVIDHQVAMKAEQHEHDA